MEIKIKRTIAILLVVCFLVSLTATAVSAHQGMYPGGGGVYKTSASPASVNVDDIGAQKINNDVAKGHADMEDVEIKPDMFCGFPS